jgi:hypothetical protein
VSSLEAIVFSKDISQYMQLFKEVDEPCTTPKQQPDPLIDKDQGCEYVLCVFCYYYKVIIILEIVVTLLLNILLY